MRRVLRPGPRAFIAFAILFGAIALLLLGVGVAHGRGLRALDGIVWFAILYAVVCAGILRARIVVTRDAIAYRAPFGIFERSVPFSQVTASTVSVLVEPEHPVTLEIFTDRDAPALTVRLKAFRQSDVRWLLALHELKVER
jgi:hypothetical protein